MERAAFKCAALGWLAVISQHEQSPALPRLDGVDTLRGGSIVAVVLLHIWIRFRFFDLNLGHDWPQMLRQLVWHNGGNGVTVFFAVSGFLITLTSLRRFGRLGAVRPWVFYRIRFARIMPLLVLLLVVLSALHLAHIEGFQINEKYFTLPRALFSALTFHLNWLEASRNAWLPACWTVLWSLSIEEMFYLFFPLVCVGLLWRGGRWGMVGWVGVALTLVALGPLARTVWAHTDLQYENSYLAGMSHIALGCVTAWLTNRVAQRGVQLRRSSLLLLQICGWLMIVAFATWPRWAWLRVPMQVLGRMGIDDTLLALGTCLILAAVALGGVRGKVWTAPLRWFGRHSYEVYLSHEFVVMLGIDVVFARVYPHGGAPRVAVAGFVVGILGLTAPLGWALARWFSEPMNRWLRGGARAAR
jgi:peptidoglycan/LPS O-acetylase OafA/YrhL